MSVDPVARGLASGLPKRANIFTVIQSILANLGVGTTNPTARLQVQTEIAFTGYAVDVYQYATQGLGTNTVLLFAGHNYTDSDTMALDTVGAGGGLRIKQANNAAARADKPSTYIGTGLFLDFQRANLGGGSSGNLGNGNDRLAYFNPSGNLVFYGTNAADWSGTNGTAPLQIGTYAHLLNRTLYMGYDDTNNKAIIGAIDSGGGVFTPIDIAALALRPNTDNFATSGSASKRWKDAYAVTFHPGAGTTSWTSGSGSPNGVLTGNPGDLYTNTAGGAATTLYVKESGSATNTGWVAK